MTRATDIAYQFEKERFQSRTTGHSTLDLISLAYDDVLQQRDQALDRASRAEGELDSMCVRTAAQVTQYTEGTRHHSLASPETWVLAMGLKQSVRMTCAHPSQWDKAALARVIKNTADTFAHQLWGAAIKEKE